LRAWVFGTVHFAVALHWIVEPFLVDAAKTGWMAPFALIFLAGGLALFWAAAGALAHWLSAGSRFAPLCFGLALAAAEALRGLVFTGFPWALPGHVLIASPGVPAAGWLGPFGLSLVVLVGAGLLCVPRWRLAAPVLWGAVILGGALVPAAPPPAPDALVLRLVQPNAPQHLKWQRDFIPVFFRRGLLETAAAPAAPDGAAPALVIWPETALPELLERSETARAAIAEAAGDTPVLVGAQAFGPDGRPRNLVALLEGGAITATYEKHHLVPFGEYLPLAPVFDLIGVRGLAETLAGGYRPGVGPATLDVPGIGRVFVMICYEAIFPNYIRSVERPRLLAHLTNDAWFGDFAGPHQHLALARLRAAEQGLPLVRAANTGISAVIDARGRVTQSLALNTSGGIDAPLPAALPPTLYARTGDGPAWAVTLMGLAVFYGRRRRILG
jgi:apolipoprotein N-acyltransferase